MKKLLKKLKDNRGFSLAECVVALGLLSIMSLMVAMVLTGAIRIKNQTMSKEEEIGEQIHAIANDDVGESGMLEATPFDKELAFYNGTDIVDSIADEVNKISADRIYDSQASMQIGALKYDYGSYQSEIKKEQDRASGKELIYGGAKLSHALSVTESEKTENGDFYDVKWVVNFSVGSYAPDESMKIVLPYGSVFDTFPAGVSNQNIMGISKDTIRFEPNSTTTSVTISFKVPKENYQGEYPITTHFGVEKQSNQVTYTKSGGIQ